MDAIDGIRRSCPRRSVRTALPPAASPPMSCDTGRAAAGRAGSFNSGKNDTVLPEVEVRRTGTGKNAVLPD
jgi:hypothetical protein